MYNKAKAMPSSCAFTHQAEMRTKIWHPEGGRICAATRHRRQSRGIYWAEMGVQKAMRGYRKAMCESQKAQEAQQGHAVGRVG